MARRAGGPFPGQLRARHSAPPAAPPALGRRRYLLAWGSEEDFGEVARALEAAGGETAAAGSPSERLLLYEARAGRLWPIGSLRLGWLEEGGSRLPELSCLSLPGDPWHAAGAVTERNVLLLHAGIRRARAAGASEGVLLLGPALLSRLMRAAPLFCLEAGAAAPAGLCRARLTLSPRAEAKGFEVVLSEGRGLERLALFPPEG